MDTPSILLLAQAGERTNQILRNNRQRRTKNRSEASEQPTRGQALKSALINGGMAIGCVALLTASVVAMPFIIETGAIGGGVKLLALGGSLAGVSGGLIGSIMGGLGMAGDLGDAIRAKSQSPDTKPSPKNKNRPKPETVVGHKPTVRSTADLFADESPQSQPSAKPKTAIKRTRAQEIATKRGLQQNKGPS